MVGRLPIVCCVSQGVGVVPDPFLLGRDLQFFLRISFWVSLPVVTLVLSIDIWGSAGAGRNSTLLFDRIK